MSKYLLVESRDPFQNNDVGRNLELAANLQKSGNEVTLFLVDNGVLPARKSALSGRLSELASAGVTVLADSFSLRERAIGEGALAEGVKAAPIETVVDALERGVKAVWH